MRIGILEHFAALGVGTVLRVDRTADGELSGGEHPQREQGTVGPDTIADNSIGSGIQPVLVARVITVPEAVILAGCGPGGR